MADKLPIAVLISGRGRTLKNLLDYIDAGRLDVDVRLVVASSSAATGLQYAEKAGIPLEIVKSADFNGCGEFSEAVFTPCRRAKVRYVVMAGYLKLLQIPNDFADRVLNIHPSLIPSFCGAGFYGRRVHEAALERGVKVSGCTVHFVNDEYDAGPILLQETVPVLEGDTVDALSDRVLNDAEFVAYPKALQLLAENRVQIVESSNKRVVRILPKNEDDKADGWFGNIGQSDI